MPDRPEDLIRRLGRRYATVLLIVAGLLVGDQAIIQPLLVRLNTSAPVINLAGRQRMLSQRIVKHALARQLSSLESDVGPREVLCNVENWQRIHRGLQSGDVELRLPKPADPRIADELRALNPVVVRIASNVAQLVTKPESRERINDLLSAERVFLPAMDRIVQRFEDDSQRQVARLRGIAIATTGIVILLMTGLYWLVLRPAATLIRTQVDRLSAHERELELRVVERTRQLMETNTALAAAAQGRQLGDQRNLELQSQLAHVSRITSLGELATGIAHEINQPLGAIANFSETLLILAQKNEIDRPGIITAAERIRDSAQRAGQIIRRMRNFVRSREHARSPERINPLITEVCSLCESDLSNHRVNLDLDSTVAAFVEADPIEIQQVLVNLLRNAVQAMEHQNARSLQVSTTLEDSMVCISVDDSGLGFPDDLEDFPRPLRSSKKDGMGLGLSISQSIIARHGGRLQLQNRPEGGARVLVWLPIINSLGEHREPADSLCCR